MPTRNVNLTDELDRFVLEKVESGRYENASEVVRAALRNLDREEREFEAETRARRSDNAENTSKAFARDRHTSKPPSRKTSFSSFLYVSRLALNVFLTCLRLTHAGDFISARALETQARNWRARSSITSKRPSRIVFASTISVPTAMAHEPAFRKSRGGLQIDAARGNHRDVR